MKREPWQSQADYEASKSLGRAFWGIMIAAVVYTAIKLLGG